MDQFGGNEQDIETRLRASGEKLFAVREERIRPGRDDKILTSWNALMIQGMATAARLLARDDCRQSARRALDFIGGQMWRDGRLLATARDGHAHLAAYLDDYAFLLAAVLEMLQLEWRNDDLLFARDLADALLQHFEDRDNGGFFFTAHDHETLLHRMKSFGDESLPSGNGVATRALLQLGWLLGEPRYLQSAERSLRAAWENMQKHPLAHAGMLMALGEFLSPTEVVILRARDDLVPPWRAALTTSRPTSILYAIPPDTTVLPEALAAKRPQGDAVAYLCRGTLCSEPLTEPAGLAASD
jgi:uncharacterized protein YyaL (SSP411 family)